MNRFKILAFTHNNLQLEDLGKLHLEMEEVAERMADLKSRLHITELMYVSTCNRVEYLLVFEKDSDAFVKEDFLACLHPEFSEEKVNFYAGKGKDWFGINAVNHLIEVASSLDSMVLGEREIITQVKNAYEFASKNGLAGDMLRIVLKQTIETAKRIFSETDIAKSPVSVVSLAYQKLASLSPPMDSRILIIGAGTTNVNMCRFLKEHGFENYTVYNRNADNAKVLAEFVGGEAHALSDLGSHATGFDILLSCTAAAEPIVTREVYEKLRNGEKDKIVIDLAVPADIVPEVVSGEDVTYIDVSSLKKVSDQNLELRRRELIKVRQLIYESLEDFKKQFKLRQIELQMRELPERVKEIRKTAVSEVFSREIDKLDDESKETLEKVLNYMEKKYVSVPMLVAKKLIDNNQNK